MYTIKLFFMEFTNIAKGIIITSILILAFLYMPSTTVFYDASSLPYCEDTISVKKQLPTTTVTPMYYNEALTADYPAVWDIIEAFPYDVKAAGIIKLNELFEQKPNNCWDEIGNSCIRAFYCIKQPAIRGSGIWVNGETRFFEENQWVIADCSREHSMFNRNRMRPCYLLFIDFTRDSYDEYVAHGTSEQKNQMLDELFTFFPNHTVNVGGRS
jgi:hypothetical protein